MVTGLLVQLVWNNSKISEIKCSIKYYYETILQVHHYKPNLHTHRLKRWILEPPISNPFFTKMFLGNKGIS